MKRPTTAEITASFQKGLQRAGALPAVPKPTPKASRPKAKVAAEETAYTVPKAERNTGRPATANLSPEEGEEAAHLSGEERTRRRLRWRNRKRKLAGLPPLLDPQKAELRAQRKKRRRRRSGSGLRRVVRKGDGRRTWVKELKAAGKWVEGLKGTGKWLPRKEYIAKQKREGRYRPRPNPSDDT